MLLGSCSGISWNRVLGDNGIQHVWIKVSAILPDDCAKLWMNLDLGKVCQILQGGEDAGELKQLVDI